jgi:hypothetical protein
MVPAPERVRDYAVACVSFADNTMQRERIISCIAVMLRLEEDRNARTSDLLRQTLVMLDSGFTP